MKPRKGRQPRFPGRKKRSLKRFFADKHAVQMRNGKLWIIPNVIVDAWKNQFQNPCTIIVFHRNGAKDPLVLAHSNGDDDISVDEAMQLVNIYFQRWDIEDLFLELKCYFQLEDFKITTIKAITRYLMICIVAHSLLQLKQLLFHPSSILPQFIQFVLKKKRNIKPRLKPPYITLESLKLFYEMLFSPLYDFNSLFRLFLNLNTTSVC